MQAKQIFERLSPESPAVGSQPITPANTDLAEPIRSLVVFTAGDVRFTAVDGSEDTWTIPSGAVPYLIPVAMKRVWLTGTTAGGLKGLL